MKEPSPSGDSFGGGEVGEMNWPQQQSTVVAVLGLESPPVMSAISWCVGGSSIKNLVYQNVDRGMPRLRVILPETFTTFPKVPQLTNG